MARQTISREQLARLAYQAGFRGDDIWKVIAIAGRESNYNPRAYNPNTSTGDKSYGLMQINMLGSMGPERLSQFGLSNADQLFDPLTNLKAAHQLYAQSNNSFYPWGPYRGESELRGTDPMAAQHAYYTVRDQPGGFGPDVATASTFAPFGSLNYFDWQSHPELNNQYNQLSPHLAAFERWTMKNYGGTNAGDYVEREITGGGPPSTHAFGAAFDWSPPSRDEGLKLVDLVTKNPSAFGIDAIHDYQGGRIWHVDRPGYPTGWKPYDFPAGDASDTHFHFETNPDVWNRVGRRNWRAMRVAARGTYPEGGVSAAGAAPGAAPGAGGGPGYTPPDRVHSAALSKLLRNLGVRYPNAPTPTPSLLAYLAGVGLDLSTAEDLRRTGMQRIRTNAQVTRQAINRAAGRTTENITSDLVSRGVLASGEANKRYTRHAQDVATERADLARQAGTLREDVATAYGTSRESLLRSALQNVADVDTQQQIEEAINRATARGSRRAGRVSRRQYNREQSARETANQALIDLINRLGRQGIG